ncbi:MAG: FixH family protein [Hyphomicrobiales bacterium]
MKLKPATLWPAAVIAALGVTVIANVAILIASSDPRKSGVERDYYAKAVAWDTTAAERGRSVALGWSADARLSPDPAGARVRISLADRAGAPLTGARVSLEAIHNFDPEHPATGLLPETEPGVYAATLPLHHRGLWELRVTAIRGTNRFFTSLRRDREGGS